jgi:predicted porin
MKKSVLTLAALCTVAASASAQSSVTLFGVIDLAYRYVRTNGVSQSQLAQDGLGSSRLGFRGVEDLGGGLSASFWLEGTLNPDTGTQPLAAINGNAPANPNAVGTFTRRSTVSMSGSWGEVRLGRDYTATFWSAQIFDPFGLNGVGSAGNIVVVPGTAGGVTVPTGSAYGTIQRANNMVGYFIPSGTLGGLYGQFQVAAGENSFGNKYLGGRIGYATGPFNAAVAYGKTEVSGNIDGDQWNIGGSWNFGILSVSGFYSNLGIEELSQENWFVSARAPIGLWTLKASYGQVSRSGKLGTININGQDARQIALGAVYDVSKRTALYGTWAGINNKGGARFIVAPMQNIAVGGAVANADSQGFEVGIRHLF